MVYGVFFFKQKTAYEMRISDWSSDVCSSDLEGVPITPRVKDEIWTALQNIASGPIEQRTLTVLTGLIQDQTVQDALNPYTLAGPPGYLLDSEGDTLSPGSNLQAARRGGASGTVVCVRVCLGGRGTITKKK